MDLIGIIKDATIIFVIAMVLVVSYGVVLWKLEEVSNSLMYKKLGYKGIVVTGFGTMIHELAHLIFVLLFGMKATKVSLLRPFKAKEDGVMGYVEYSYNKNSRMHKVGLFFVNVAPIFMGVLVMALLTRIFLPETYVILKQGVWDIINIPNITITSGIGNGWSLFLKVILSMFSMKNFLDVKFYIYLFLVMSVSSHMSLSRADINGVMRGMFSIYLISVSIFAMIIGFSFGSISAMWIVQNIIVYMGVFLTTALIFSSMNVAIAMIINKI